MLKVLLNMMDCVDQCCDHTPNTRQLRNSYAIKCNKCGKMIKHKKWYLAVIDWNKLIRKK